MAQNEEQQMQAIFKSRRTDPVSGNEVPPGSLPQEVRDDVPAMLSEGEYVVPADVLRYYGVKFFEDLRMEAKMGLSGMAEDGRIGGAEIEDADELPFSDEELVAEDDAMPSEAEMEAALGGLVGFADGGTPAITFPSYINQPDISQFATGVTAGIEYRKYTNDAGMTLTVPFFNGQPMAAVPSGYYPDTGETKKKDDKTTTEEREGRGPDERDVVEPGEWASDITSDNVVDWANEALGLSTGEKAIGMLGLPGKGLTALSQATSVAQVRGLAITAAAQGNKALAATLNGLADDTVKNSPVLTAMDRIGLMPGTGYANGLSKTDVNLSGGTVAGVQGKDKGEGRDGGYDFGPGGDAPSGSAQEAADVAAQPGGTTAGGLDAGVVGLGDISESGSGMDVSMDAENDNDNEGPGVGPGSASGPFAKGGLVSRRKKK